MNEPGTDSARLRLVLEKVRSQLSEGEVLLMQRAAMALQANDYVSVLRERHRFVELTKKTVLNRVSDLYDAGMLEDQKKLTAAWEEYQRQLEKVKRRRK